MQRKVQTAMTEIGDLVRVFKSGKSTGKTARIVEIERDNSGRRIIRCSDGSAWTYDGSKAHPPGSNVNMSVKIVSA